MILKRLKDSFGHIIFYDDKHIYVDTSTGNQLQSVTTRIGKLKKPFNTDFWSVYKAFEASGYTVKNPIEHKYTFKVDGQWVQALNPQGYTLSVTPQDIQDKWKEIGRQGRELGSQHHDFMEFATERKFKKYPRSRLEKMGEQYIIDSYIRGPLVVIKNELVVGNDNLAGMIDNYSYNTEKDEYYLIDYKTDKKFEMKSKYREKYYAPLEHLQVCEFTKYSLQLSCYRYLMEEKDIPINDSFVIWFPKKEDELMHVIKCEYLRGEAEYLCNLKS